MHRHCVKGLRHGVRCGTIPPAPGSILISAKKRAIQLDILILTAGGIVLVLSLLAGYIVNRSWVSEVTVCLLLGAALGPLAGLFLQHQLLGDDRLATLEQVARISLGIAVMGVALRLPERFVFTHWRELALSIGPGLAAMWLSSAALACFLLHLPLLSALLVGAAVAPTDPVVSQSIVAGRIADKHIPARVRNLISAESGSNDGLGVLFVMLPVLLIQHPAGGGIGAWLRDVLLVDVVASTGIGALIGWLAGKLFVWAKGKPYSEDQSMLTIALALSLSVLAGVDLLGGDGILAVFAAGALFNRGIAGIETRQGSMHGAITRFFDLPVFLLIGMLLPWQRWWQMGWPLLAFAIGLLFVRRLPWWLLLSRWLPSFTRLDETLFVGWFGPIGVAAAYYALSSQGETHFEWLWPTVSLAIFVSVLVHGITATPFVKLLGSRIAADTPDEDDDRPASA